MRELRCAHFGVASAVAAQLFRTDFSREVEYIRAQTDCYYSHWDSLSGVQELLNLLQFCAEKIHSVEQAYRVYHLLLDLRVNRFITYNQGYWIITCPLHYWVMRL